MEASCCTNLVFSLPPLLLLNTHESGISCNYTIHILQLICLKNDPDLGVAVLFIQELTFLHSPENQLSVMTTGIHNSSPTKNWGINAKLENKA